jgi:hypothetical protein
MRNHQKAIPVVTKTTDQLLKEVAADARFLNTVARLVRENRLGELRPCKPSQLVLDLCTFSFRIHNSFNRVNNVYRHFVLGLAMNGQGVPFLCLEERLAGKIPSQYLVMFTESGQAYIMLDENVRLAPSMRGGLMPAVLAGAYQRSLNAVTGKAKELNDAARAARVPAKQ